MTTLPAMGLALPARGSSGAGIWDDTIDDDLGLIDAHDHSVGKGNQINTDGIIIDADLSFHTLWAPTNMNRITFASITALAANNKSLFVNGADSELYWRSATGNNVKLTSGSALNVAAFTGGIGGDYSAVSATEAFDDSAKRYTFKDGSGNWARAALGGVRLIEFGTSESLYVGLLAPAALAASYDVTLPLAAPASTSLVQMSSTGVLTASNTVANAITASALITASAGVTCAVDQHVTVSGTGRHKHGLMTMSVPWTAFHQISSATAVVYSTAIGSAGITGSAFTVEAPITLPVGCRILAVRVYVADNSTGPTKLLAEVISCTSTGTLAAIAGPTAQTSGSGASQTLTMSSINVTIANLISYSILVQTATGSADCAVYMAEIDYDLP